MKRFTETTKWSDPWFRRLSPRLKCLWMHLVDICDCSGVLDPDWELMSVHIGEKVSQEDMKYFGDRVGTTEAGKLVIMAFIPFQYGKLSEDCKAHAPIFKAKEAHALDRVSIGYPKAIDSHKEKDKEKEKDNSLFLEPQISKLAQPINRDFEIFWSAYPRKNSKGDALKAWKAGSPPLQKCLDAIAELKKSPDWMKDGGQFIPYPATWIRAQGWLDEGLKLEPATGGKYDSAW